MPACGGHFDTHKLELTWNSSATGPYFSKKSHAAGILIPILRLSSIALATTEVSCNYKTQVVNLSSQIYCHKSSSDLNKPTPWSSIRSILRIPEVKLWFIIELIISSNFQSTVLLNFIPEFENLKKKSSAAILIIFKNIHQTLKRNSELNFNDLNCKSCLRNLQIKASRIA